ncbi:MAG: P83/100 family protein [Spirochaetia bacterium]
MKRLMLALLLCVPLSLSALDVAEDELSPYVDTTIEFQNYEGPREVVQTLEEIRGIGAFIGAQFEPDAGTFSYFGRYTVIHAVDPSVDVGLDADIMLLAEDARVDHINNLRTILRAYLETAYDYSLSDASLLAEYITIYNAVFRGNLEFFQGRYKPVVLQHLSETSVGLSVLYSDWPGGTEMVIPLRDGGRPGAINAVGPQELLEPEVIASLRDRPDMGIETRRDMVDLLERVIDETLEEVEEEREELEAEAEELAERERQAPDELSPEEREQIADQREDVEQRQAEIAEREDAVEELTEDVRRLRDELAEDIETVLDREEDEQEQEIAAVPADQDDEEPESEEPAEVGDPEPEATEADPNLAVFMLVRRENGVVVGRLARVVAETGEQTDQSSLDMVYGRRFLELDGNYILIADDAGTPRLTQVDTDSLEPILFGDQEIAAGSMLATSGGAVFAVMREDNSWYLGRFTAGLELLERSRVVVDPDTYILFSGPRVYVQTTDGSVRPLNQTNMTAE